MSSNPASLPPDLARSPEALSSTPRTELLVEDEPLGDGPGKVMRAVRKSELQQRHATNGGSTCAGPLGLGGAPGLHITVDASCRRSMAPSLGGSDPSGSSSDLGGAGCDAGPMPRGVRDLGARLGAALDPRKLPRRVRDLTVDVMCLDVFGSLLPREVVNLVGEEALKGSPPLAAADAVARRNLRALLNADTAKLCLLLAATTSVCCGAVGAAKALLRLVLRPLRVGPLRIGVPLAAATALMPTSIYGALLAGYLVITGAEGAMVRLSEDSRRRCAWRHRDPGSASAASRHPVALTTPRVSELAAARPAAPPTPQQALGAPQPGRSQHHRAASADSASASSAASGARAAQRRRALSYEDTATPGRSLPGSGTSSPSHRELAVNTRLPAGTGGCRITVKATTAQREPGADDADGDDAAAAPGGASGRAARRSPRPSDDATSSGGRTPGFPSGQRPRPFAPSHRGSMDVVERPPAGQREGAVVGVPPGSVAAAVAAIINGAGGAAPSGLGPRKTGGSAGGSPHASGSPAASLLASQAAGGAAQAQAAAPAGDAAEAKSPVGSGGQPAPAAAAQAAAEPVQVEAAAEPVQVEAAAEPVQVEAAAGPVQVEAAAEPVQVEAAALTAAGEAEAGSEAAAGSEAPSSDAADGDAGVSAAALMSGEEGDDEREAVPPSGSRRWRSD